MRGEQNISFNNSSYSSCAFWYHIRKEYMTDINFCSLFLTQKPSYLADRIDCFPKIDILGDVFLNE